MSLRIFPFFYRSKGLISDTSRKNPFFIEIFKNFTTNVSKKHVTLLASYAIPRIPPRRISNNHQIILKSKKIEANR